MLKSNNVHITRRRSRSYLEIPHPARYASPLSHIQIEWSWGEGKRCQGRVINSQKIEFPVDMGYTGKIFSPLSPDIISEALGEGTAEGRG